LFDIDTAIIKKTQEKGTILVNEKPSIEPVRPTFNDVIHIIRHHTFRLGVTSNHQHEDSDYSGMGEVAFHAAKIDIDPLHRKMDFGFLLDLPHQGSNVEVVSISIVSTINSQQNTQVSHSLHQQQGQGLDVKSYRHRAKALEGGPFLNIKACYKALVGMCYGMESVLVFVLVQFEQIRGTMIFPF
jgi:hypothetical protein